MKKILLAIIICLVISASVFGYFMYMAITKKTKTAIVTPIASASINQNITNDSWILTITYVFPIEGYMYYCYHSSNIGYILHNHSGLGSVGNLSDIRNNPCVEYNITWLDKDWDYYLSLNDEFIINKAGGSMGKMKQGDEFGLVAHGSMFASEILQ